MSVLDLLLVALIAAAVCLGFVRGFGKAAFEACALYCALWIATEGYRAFAGLFSQAPTPVAEAVAYGVVFLASATALLFLAYLIHRSTLLNAGVFDRLLGVIGGFAAGMMVAHAVVRAVALGCTPDGSAMSLVDYGPLSDQMLNFTYFHQVVQTLTSLTNGPMQASSD